MNKQTIYIFTLIKDMQRYLDEWIEYHLNIGIDKIIIFEDINSKSHNIDKYDKNKVIIYKVENCFDEEDKKPYNMGLKQKGCFSCFNRLFGKKCDWSTCIDVDEFIECNDIQDIIKDKEKYAQIMMLWKIYTYNGYIKDPFPNQIYSVRNTYTKYNNSIWEKKSLFNMHHELIIKNFNNPNHFPHTIIDYNDKENAIWSNYKIGHYYTKSFEEYIYDLYNRGRLDGWSLGKNAIDRFFEANELNKNDFKDIIELYKDKQIKINYNIIKYDK